jgi:TnpA family transposase
MGLGAMAESCGVPYDTLAWTAEWYFRAETLAAANAAIVNYHHRLPMTQAFGTGTLASSDGQKFPVKGKSLTAKHLSRYFARGQGVSAYTHVSDQHSTFDTKVIAATAPESPYALDGILGNQTDLLITEHATDTAGATLANFALFDLVGLQLSPPDPRPGQDYPLPDRAAGGLHGPLPVRRSPAHPPAQRGPHHGHVG